MLSRSSTLSILRRRCRLLSATWASSTVRLAKMSSATVRSEASCLRELVNAPFATASSSAPTGQLRCSELDGTWPRHRCRGFTFRITNGIAATMPAACCWVTCSRPVALAHNNTLQRRFPLIAKAPPHHRAPIPEAGCTPMML